FDGLDREGLLVDVFGSVVLRAFEGPGLDRPNRGIRCCRPVERHWKGERDRTRLGVQGHGNRKRPLGAPHTEEATRLRAVAGPGEQTAGVELAVRRAEPAAHDAGGKIGDRQGDHASLHVAGPGGRRLREHEVDAAHAVG
ncbi:MAG: hypothetical protein ACK56I_01545, partial [bacterium]